MWSAQLSVRPFVCPVVRLCVCLSNRPVPLFSCPVVGLSGCLSGCTRCPVVCAVVCTIVQLSVRFPVVCPGVKLFVRLSGCLNVRLSGCLSVSPFVGLFSGYLICPFVYPVIRLYDCLSNCPVVCLVVPSSACSSGCLSGSPNVTRGSGRLRLPYSPFFKAKRCYARPGPESGQRFPRKVWKNVTVRISLART